MEEVLERIHRYSLEIMEDPGVRLHDDEILNKLASKGVKVKEDIVHFTEEQVTQCLALAPSSFNLTARNPDHNLTIGDNSRCIAGGFGAPMVVTAENRRREAQFDDYIRAVKLIHATDLVHLNGGVLVQPKDIPPDLASLIMIYTALTLSDKPFMGIQDHEPQLRRIMALNTILFGGEEEFKKHPKSLYLVSTFSPLQIDAQGLATLKVCCEYNQAICITPGLMCGATSPITPAGSLVQANAEFLTGLCTAQMLAPGTPIVYGCLGTPVDMRTGVLTLGSPARTAFTNLAAAMAEKYNIPNRGIGTVTDAGQVSVQSGYESMFSLSGDYQRRTSFILHGAGILDSFSAFSFEKWINDLEIIRILNKSYELPKLDEDDFALETIRNVGPGGEFLTSPHTMKHCRSIPFSSDLAPFKTEDPQHYLGILSTNIQKELSKLEAAYQLPNMPPKVQEQMDEFIVNAGVSEEIVHAVRPK